MPAQPPLPLIRHLSRRVSPLLIRTPLSANQVTAASLLAGLGACALLLSGRHADALAAAALLVLAYVLDNCDGEVARAKGQASLFGRQFDSFVDWIVHAGFFAALGWGVAAASGAAWWLHLGLLGAAGASINYALGVIDDIRALKTDPGARARFDLAPEEGGRPQGALQWAVYALRELSRADFCFIVLGLAFADALWVLLPTAAIGAHAYWIARFVKGAGGFRT